ncbi:MAG TPA: Ig-like domain-containing protein [Candidatus Paceibacterota bacterium]
MKEKNHFLILSLVLALFVALSFNSIASAKTQLNRLPNEITVEGTLEIEHTDNFKDGISNTRYFLKENGNRYSLRFSHKEPNLLSGSKVRVRGSKRGMEIGVLYDTGATDNLVTINSATIPTATVKKIAVILINFQNNSAQPFTSDTVRSVNFTAANGINAYYQEESFGYASLEGKIRPDGDVYGWYTTPSDNTTCDISSLASAAQTAAVVDGFDPAGYNSIVYAFPYTASCAFAGAATIGGNPGQVWINGSYNLRIVGHELGHNFGAHHARSYSCTDPAGRRVAISDTCTASEYGDIFDIMGSGLNHQMNNFLRGRLGWFADYNTQDVLASGTYTISPIEQLSSGVQALRIPKDKTYSGNILNYYYLEFRQPFGFDNFAVTDPVVNGVSIRIAPDYPTITQTSLLDATPDTNGFFDSALAVGQIFEDATNGIAVQTLSVSPTSATVAVTVPIPCIRANPSVSLAPASQSGTPGQTLAYTLTLTNNDSSVCSYSWFNITSSIPSGWTQVPASFDSALFSGQSATIPISITSASDAAVGTYTVTEKAANQGNPALNSSSSTNYEVQIPDTTPPVVAITNPTNGFILPSKGFVNVNATASDVSGIKHIDIYIDNKIVATCAMITSCSYQWTMSYKISSGKHAIKATAYDNSPAGNSASKTITVRKR